MSSQTCQLGYGVHVAGGAVHRSRDPEFRFADSVAVVDVNLPLAEPDFFAGLTGDFRQGGRRRRPVQEDRHRAIGGAPRKGICLEDRGQFGRSSEQNSDGLAGIGLQAGFERRPDLGFGFPAVEDHIAAGDEGSDLGKAGSLAHGLQVAHRKLAGAADVHGSQKRNEGFQFRSRRLPCVANKCASTAGSPRRGRLLGWFAENPATAFAQAGPLPVHAGSNALHTRNFRCTKPKNVAGAKPALIVLRKRVTRYRQHRQTNSQNRCDPWIMNCEQIDSHMVSPGLTDVAVATRRLAVLESYPSSYRCECRRFKILDHPCTDILHRRCRRNCRSLIWNQRRSPQRTPRGNSRIRRRGFPAISGACAHCDSGRKNGTSSQACWPRTR